MPVDGFLSQQQEQQQQQQPDPADASAAEPQPATTFVTKRIPPRIIQNAVGLAVFSCMRSGLWMSGSGGAGLITARKADGTWSPPSGIILHTAELAFVMGVDIYDCVLIINSVQTLELFTRPRLVLGVDVNLAVGPLVAAGSQEPEVRWQDVSDTVLTYVKARGRHQAVQLDGSLVTERCNENERFYGSSVTVLDILAGNVRKDIPEMRPLFEVIKAAEGRSDYDKALMDWLAQQPAPGDAEIESPSATVPPPAKTAFGLPDANDPDPFGVIGLEMAGIEIREAGSKLRPTSTQFEYNPSPTSPAYARFSRQSLDTFVSRSNRGSCMSSRTQTTTMTDACTQTDVSTADTIFSRANSDDGKDSVEKLPTVPEPEEVDYTQIDTSAIDRLKRRTIEVPRPTEPKDVKTTAAATTESAEQQPKDTGQITDNNNNNNSSSSPRETPATQTADGKDVDADDEADDEDEEEEDDDDDDDDDEDEDDEPIVCEVATAAAQPTRSSIRSSQGTQIIQAKGAIVTIPKRVPPPLPAKNPARASRGSRSDFGDASSLRSPVRNSFLSVESHIDYSLPPADAPPAPAPAPASIDDALAAPESKQEQPPSSPPQRPASPRHQRNSSSVCTAVAVDDVRRRTSFGASEATRDPQAPAPSPSPPAPARSPASSSPAVDDEPDENDDKEPRTPRAAPGSRTSEDLPSGPAKPGAEGAGIDVRIVSPTESADEGAGSVTAA